LRTLLEVSDIVFSLKQPTILGWVSLLVAQTYGEYVAGTLNEQERLHILSTSCPGAGACGGMYTANTMASCIEAMGMSLPYRKKSDAEPLCSRPVHILAA
jgi:dihydroxyacid dehydratase/phosphogluconate dehydratase